MTNANPASANAFVKLLNDPTGVAGSLTLVQWDLVVRQARSAGMLGRVFHLLHSNSVIDLVPDAPLRHFRWGEMISRRHAKLVSVEVDGIARVLSSLPGPIVLLKGAAYCYGNLDVLTGRIFTDIDVLVNEPQIEVAETLLERHGWLSSHMSDYDQRYYRRWMHELPPMKHGQRQTELDLHHAILPKTSRFTTESSLLLSNLKPLNEQLNLYRLCDEDLLLHSSAHLFFDGEFKHGFRDLEDIRSILNSWNLADAGWNSLLDRASLLGLSHPCFFALYFSQEWFGVDVPKWVLKKVSADAGLGWFRKKVLLNLFYQSLMPVHHSCESSVNTVARYCLYLRSHYLRMPVHLLIPHLFYKSISPIIDRFKNMNKDHLNGGVLQRLTEGKTK